MQTDLLALKGLARFAVPFRSQHARGSRPIFLVKAGDRHRARKRRAPPPQHIRIVDPQLGKVLGNRDSRDLFNLDDLSFGQGVEHVADVAISRTEGQHQPALWIGPLLATNLDLKSAQG